jgi:hypothetical protein
MGTSFKFSFFRAAWRLHKDCLVHVSFTAVADAGREQEGRLRYRRSGSFFAMGAKYALHNSLHPLFHCSAVHCTSKQQGKRSSAVEQSLPAEKGHRSKLEIDN